MYLMIVSGEERAADQLTAAFAGSGYILSYAVSAEDALGQLAGREMFYDWVLTADELPDLSGLELARHIQELPHSIRIAVVTANDSFVLPAEMPGPRIFGPARYDWSGEEFGALFASVED